METRVAYKLLTLRKDKTIGPLFINRKQIIPVGEWLDAEDHPTKGYAHRCGWHSCGDICAPHLKMYGRIWCRCSIPDDSVILSVQHHKVLHGICLKKSG